MEDAYPGLCAGVLSSATIGDLPDGVLVDLGDGQITQKQIDDVLAKAPDKLRDQLSKNALFLAQDLATPRLLIRVAREWATAQKKDVTGKSDPDIISDYLQSIAARRDRERRRGRQLLPGQHGDVQRGEAGGRQGRR